MDCDIDEAMGILDHWCLGGPCISRPGISMLLSYTLGSWHLPGMDGGRWASPDGRALAPVMETLPRCAVGVSLHRVQARQGWRDMCSVTPCPLSGHQFSPCRSCVPGGELGFREGDGQSAVSQMLLPEAWLQSTASHAQGRKKAGPRGRGRGGSFQWLEGAAQTAGEALPMEEGEDWREGR